MPFISDLNDLYFDGALSQAVLALLEPIEKEGPEAQAFVRRAFDQMHRQNVGARDFPQTVAWALGALISKVLPGAWGGIVPPITNQGRHRLIDRYLTNNKWRQVADGDHILDLGCGFPPVTTLDTAECFPNCQVTGADPSFGTYLIRDAQGDYAVFDANGDLIYFQQSTVSAGMPRFLLSNAAETRARFSGYLEKLQGSLPDGVDGLSTVGREGVTLTRNPVLEFGGDNVTFAPYGIGATDLGRFQVVRCFNVLFYFDDAFRTMALDWFGRVITDGGIAICGGDGAFTRYARYMVYRSETGVMRPKEFAFSLDNVRPLEVMPLFSLHDDDRDRALMAKLVGVLRSDTEFLASFDGRMDELMEDNGLGSRTSDGYLGPLPKETNAYKFVELSGKVTDILAADGFARQAVNVLRHHGYDAWVNGVGHVAVVPDGPGLSRIRVSGQGPP
jgi:SAM-dependent methyltransferase